MANYSIKDLEHLSGIKAHTLRIWEQRYNLINPKRTETNIRFYDQDDLKLILNVSLLKDNGIKISKIAEMTREQLNEAIINISDNSTNFADQIYALTLCMIDLDEQRFEKIINSNTLKHGFERTMMNLVIPFLSKIGVMWLTDAINPAQEHFISHLVRQKIMVAIDGQQTNVDSSAKKYMLFLPEGELHELILLFANYLIKSRGGRVIYLGQTLPIDDLKMAHEIYEPEYLITVLTGKPLNSTPTEYIEELSNLFPDSEILVSGRQVVGQDLQLPDNVTSLASLNDLITFVEENSTITTP
ncbi:MerR family transcriptional regulator [Roseivirga echinicomitans]|uniref:MerR family transcriptional regulator n=1 Tax=Roseivirga echinicomitans TaxID=296218 RepID=A0A150XXG1_9BACT|nr:MerR family transcriptional regulator [Roseivirga echinicomitans]KYG83441.1 MerR family transcriptional regulator [Roseivirga echinicomitans]